MDEDLRQVERRKLNKMVPMGSTWNDLFTGGYSVWLKIVGGAIATLLVVFMALLRPGAEEDPLDPRVMLVIGLVSVPLGAFLGAALSLKDIVQSRLEAGHAVSFPLKLLFGFGIWSLLLVWVPSSFILVLVITLTVLI